MARIKFRISTEHELDSENYEGLHVEDIKKIICSDPWHYLGYGDEELKVEFLES